MFKNQKLWYRRLCVRLKKMLLNICHSMFSMIGVKWPECVSSANAVVKYGLIRNWDLYTREGEADLNIWRG